PGVAVVALDGPRRQPRQQPAVEHVGGPRAAGVGMGLEAGLGRGEEGALVHAGTLVGARVLPAPGRVGRRAEPRVLTRPDPGRAATKCVRAATPSHAWTAHPQLLQIPSKHGTAGEAPRWGMLALPRPQPAGADAAGRRRRARLAPYGAGVRAMAPWLPGMAMYGLVVGVAAGRAGLPAGAGFAVAPLIYSGGAQVAAAGLLGAGA